jgi:hypothetical protein
MDLPFFIYRGPYFPGLRFDSRRKNEIGCIYLFDICNNLINSVSLATLNKSQVCQHEILARSKNRYLPLFYSNIVINGKFSIYCNCYVGESKKKPPGDLLK